MQTDCGHTSLPRNIVSSPKGDPIQKCSDVVIAFYEVQPVEVLNEETYHLNYVQVYIYTEHIHCAIIKLIHKRLNGYSSPIFRDCITSIAWLTGICSAI